MGRQLKGSSIRINSVLYAILLLMLAAGCTSRNWYEGVKQSHQQQCKQMPDSERDECLAQHDDSYDQYKRKRQEISE